MVCWMLAGLTLIMGFTIIKQAPSTKATFKYQTSYIKINRSISETYTILSWLSKWQAGQILFEFSGVWIMERVVAIQQWGGLCRSRGLILPPHLHRTSQRSLLCPAGPQPPSQSLDLQGLDSTGLAAAQCQLCCHSPAHSLPWHWGCRGIPVLPLCNPG